MASENDRSEQTEVLERGNIYFIYRPRVQEEHPEGVGDVERFYMALHPRGRKRYRLFVIGRKHVPDVEEHERSWAFVDTVTDDPKALEEGLREHTYSTKTRGERVQPAARPAGEGVYAIAAIEGQLHLVYALELPERSGDVQKELGIAPEASFAVSIKNPEKGSPAAAGLSEDREADYPGSQQRKFRDRRFDREHPELLDYEGAEIVLVGARTDPAAAYGLDLQAQQEDPRTADILKDLKMARSRHPPEPLIRGEWR